LVPAKSNRGACDSFHKVIKKPFDTRFAMRLD
jgi:hypothetical protein